MSKRFNKEVLSGPAEAEQPATLASTGSDEKIKVSSNNENENESTISTETIAEIEQPGSEPEKIHEEPGTDNGKNPTKKGRGRPRKQADSDRTEDNGSTNAPGIAADSIVIGGGPEAPGSGVKPVNKPDNAVQSAPSEPKVDISKFISGETAMKIIDTIFPMIMSKGVGILTGNKYEADYEDIQLGPAIQKDLAPLAKEAMKDMLIGVSPLQGFLGVLAICYGANLATAIEKAD